MTDLRIEKGAKTRDSMIDAAIAIIAAGGLHDISTAKLAEAVGVSKSAIFHHFKSSDDVLAAALSVVFGRLERFMGAGTYSSVEHFLDSLGQSMLRVTDGDMTDVKAFLAFFHGGIFHPVIRGMLVSFAEQLNERFRALLSQLVPDHVHPDKVAAISELLLPMIDGIGFHALLSGNGAKFQSVWQLQTRAILVLLNGTDHGMNN